MSELDELRNEVDAADDAILAALKRRFDVTDRIRALKARESLPRVDAEREREILARVAAAVPYVLLWQTDSTRILYWNKFGTPRTVLSRLGREDSALSHWWYDADRAEELERAARGGTCLPAVPELVDYDEETEVEGR